MNRKGGGQGLDAYGGEVDLKTTESLPLEPADGPRRDFEITFSSRNNTSKW